MQRISEAIVLLTALNPQTVNNTPKTSAWVDASQLHELFAVLALGDMAAETIDFRIEQATDSGGTLAKPVKASTQLAAHATNNDNKQLQISAMADKLDTAGGFKWVRIYAVTSAATGGMGAGLLYGVPRYRPAVHNATVLETATL